MVHCTTPLVNLCAYVCVCSKINKTINLFVTQIFITGELYKGDNLDLYHWKKYKDN